MAGITLTQAQTQLSAYLAAETAILSGQRYEINGRMLMRADLATVQSGISLWNSRVASLTRQQNGRSRGRTVVVG